MTSSMEMVSKRMLDGKRLDRPVTVNDVSGAVSAWERIGMKANAALMRTMWDDLCDNRRKAAELEDLKGRRVFRVLRKLRVL